MTQAELLAKLQEAKVEIQKIGTETRALLAKVQELLDLIAAGGPVTPEVEAAITELREQMQVVDDLVPDAPPPPTT